MQQLSSCLMELTAKISISISSLTPKTTTLDIADRENLIYIVKFGISLSIAQYINFYQIFNNIYIDTFITASDIKLNSWFFNCLKSYKFRLTLFIKLMLKVFYDKFYE